MKFGFECQAVSQKMLETNSHLHVYSTGTGADTPWSLIPFLLSMNINYLSVGLLLLVPPQQMTLDKFSMRPN